MPCPYIGQKSTHSPEGTSARKNGQYFLVSIFGVVLEFKIDREKTVISLLGVWKC